MRTIKTFKKSAAAWLRRALRKMELRKITSLLTLMCFMASSVIPQGAFAVSSESARSGKLVAEAIADLDIPYSTGRVTDSAYFEGGRVVVNIQDLHCHTEVQRNIARLLALIDKKYGLEKVYIEGASGDLDTSWINDIGQESLKKEVVESLLSSGRLNGSEYYSITSNRPRLLKGMENSKAYDENIVRLNKIIAQKKEIENVVMPGIKAETERIKGLYYGQKNRRIGKISEQYSSGDIKAKKYYKILQKYANENAVDLGSYENLERFLTVLKAQQQLNYGKVSVQLNKFLVSLKGKLPYKEWVQIQNKTKDISRLDELYIVLARVAKTIDLNQEGDFAELKEFLDFVDINQKTDPMKLVAEEKALMNELLNRCSETQSEREIVFLVGFTEILSDYLNNKISAKDYAYFSQNLQRYRLLWAKYADSNRLEPLAEYTELLDKFYTTNIDRNGYFIEQIFGKTAAIDDKYTAPESGRTGDVLNVLKNANKATVVVTGGFHTPGFTKLLRDNKVSYIVITPSVTEDTKYADYVYDVLAKEHANILTQGIPSFVLENVFQKATPDERNEIITIGSVTGKLIMLVKDSASKEAILSGINELLKEFSGENGSQNLGFKAEDNDVYALEINRNQYRFKISGDTVKLLDLPSNIDINSEKLNYEAFALKGKRGKINQKVEKDKRKSAATIKGVVDMTGNAVDSFEMIQSEKALIAGALQVDESEFAGFLSKAFEKLEQWDKSGVAVDVEAVKKKKITLAILGKSDSKHLFEDCMDNGLIGINNEFMDIATKNPELAKILLIAGIAHELRHEAGMKDERGDLDKVFIAELLLNAGIKIDDFKAVFAERFLSNNILSGIEEEYSAKWQVIVGAAAKAAATELEKYAKLVNPMDFESVAVNIKDIILNTAAKPSVNERVIIKAVNDNNTEYIKKAFKKYLRQDVIDEAGIIKFVEVCADAVEKNYEFQTNQAAWPVTKAFQMLSYEEQSLLAGILNKHYTSEIYEREQVELPQLVIAIFLLQAAKDYESALNKGEVDKNGKFDFTYGKKIYEIIAKQLDLEGRCVYTVSPEITAKAGGLGPVIEFLGGGINFLINNLNIPDASNTLIEMWYKKNGAGNELNYLKEYGVRLEGTNADGTGSPKAIKKYKVMIGDKQRKVELFVGKDVDKSGNEIPNRPPRYFLRDVDGPDGDGNRTASNQLYKYREKGKNLGNCDKYESIPFLNIAAAETIRQLEIDRKNELKGKWNSAFVHANDAQCSYLSAVMQSGTYKDDPLVNEILHYNTIHNYFNRGDLTSVEAMHAFMDFMHIDKKFFGRNVSRDSNLSANTSDGLNGVAWDHAKDIRPDYDYTDMVGIANGADTKMLGVYFDKALERAYAELKKEKPELYSAPLDYQRPATTELFWRAKKYAREIFNNAELVPGAIGITSSTGRKATLAEDNDKVLTFVVRAVPEKIGRGFLTEYNLLSPDGKGGAFSNENIKEFVKAGWQIVIVGADQSYDISSAVVRDLAALEEEIMSDKESNAKSDYKGCFYLIKDLIGDVKKYTFAPSVLHAHWTYHHTEANGYTESPAIMGLVITANHDGGNGALAAQGSAENTILCDYSEGAFRAAVLKAGRVLDGDREAYAQRCLTTPLLNSVMHYFVASWTYLQQMSKLSKMKRKNKIDDENAIKAIVDKVGSDENLIVSLLNTGRNNIGLYNFNHYGDQIRPGLKGFIETKLAIESNNGSDLMVEHLNKGYFKKHLMKLFDGLEIGSEIEHLFELNSKNAPGNAKKKNERLNTALLMLVKALEENKPSWKKAAQLKAEEGTKKNELAKQNVSKLSTLKDMPPEIGELTVDDLYKIFFNQAIYRFNVPSAAQISGLGGLLVNLIKVSRVEPKIINEHIKNGYILAHLDKMFGEVSLNDSKLKEKLAAILTKTASEDEKRDELIAYLNIIRPYIFDMVRMIQQIKKGDVKAELNIARILRAFADADAYEKPMDETNNYYNQNFKNSDLLISQAAKDKFANDGEAKPFPGYSVIHSFRNDSKMTSGVVQFEQELEAELVKEFGEKWVKSHMAFVDEDAYLMTLYGVATWPGQEMLPQAAENAAKKTEKIFNDTGNNAQSGVYAQGLSVLSGISLVVRLHPKQSQDLEKINAIRNELHEALRDRDNDIGVDYPFIGYIPLAYLTDDISSSDMKILQEILVKYENRYITDTTIDDFELARFENMKEWKTVVKLNLRAASDTPATLPSSRVFGNYFGRNAVTDAIDQLIIAPFKELAAFAALLASYITGQNEYEKSVRNFYLAHQYADEGKPWTEEQAANYDVFSKGMKRIMDKASNARFKKLALVWGHFLYNLSVKGRELSMTLSEIDAEKPENWDFLSSLEGITIKKKGNIAVLKNTKTNKTISIESVYYKGNRYYKIGDTTYLATSKSINIARLNPIGNAKYINFFGLSLSELTPERCKFNLPIEGVEEESGLRPFPVNSVYHASLRANSLTDAELNSNRVIIDGFDAKANAITDEELMRVLNAAIIIGMSGVETDYYKAIDAVNSIIDRSNLSPDFRTLAVSAGDFLFLSFSGVDWSKWQAERQRIIEKQKNAAQSAETTAAPRKKSLFERAVEPTRLPVPAEEIGDWEVSNVEALTDTLPYLAENSQDEAVQLGQEAIDNADIVAIPFSGGAASTVKKTMGANKLIHKSLKVIDSKGNVKWISIMQARNGLLLGQNKKTKIIVVTSAGGTLESESDRSTRELLEASYPDEFKSGQISLAIQRNGLVLDATTGEPLRYDDGRVAVCAENHLWAFLAAVTNKKLMMHVLKDSKGILSMGNGDNILNYTRAGMVGKILQARKSGKSLATVAICTPSAGDRKGGFACKVTYKNNKTGKMITMTEFREVNEFPTSDSKATGFDGIDLASEKGTAFYNECGKNNMFIEDIFGGKKVAFNVAFYAVDAMLILARMFGLDENDPKLIAKLEAIDEQVWADKVNGFGAKVPRTENPKKSMPNEDGSKKVTGYITEQAVQDLIVNGLALLSKDGVAPNVEILLSERSKVFLPYKGTSQAKLDRNGNVVKNTETGKDIEEYDLVANQERYAGVIEDMKNGSVGNKSLQIVLNKYGDKVEEIIPATSVDEIKLANKEAESGANTKSAEQQLFVNDNEKQEYAEMYKELSRYSGTVLFLGHGSKSQFQNLDEAFKSVDEVVSENNAKYGVGRWVAVFGGDSYNADKPDIAHIIKYLKSKHGVPILAVQSDVVQINYGGVDKYIDYVQYVPTQKDINGKTVWGGFVDGRPAGPTAVYLKQFIDKGILKAVVTMGGGQISLQETNYAYENGIPITYVWAQAKDAAPNGEYGSLKDWVIEKTGNSTTKGKVVLNSQESDKNTKSTAEKLFSEVLDKTNPVKKINDGISDIVDNSYPVMKIAPELLGKNYFVFSNKRDGSIEETVKARVAMGLSVFGTAELPKGMRTDGMKDIGAISQAEIPVKDGNNILVNVWAKEVTAANGRKGIVLYYERPAADDQTVFSRAPLAITELIKKNTKVQEALGFGEDSLNMDSILRSLNGRKASFNIDIIETDNPLNAPEIAYEEINERIDQYSGTVKILLTDAKQGVEAGRLNSKFFDLVAAPSQKLDAMLAEAGTMTKVKASELGVSRARANVAVVVDLPVTNDGAIDVVNFRKHLIELKNSVAVDTVLVKVSSRKQVAKLGQINETVQDLQAQGLRIFMEYKAGSGSARSELLSDISEVIDSGASGLQVDVSRISDLKTAEDILVFAKKANPDIELSAVLSPEQSADRALIDFLASKDIVIAVSIEISKAGDKVVKGMQRGAVKMWYQLQVPENPAEMDSEAVDNLFKSLESINAWGIAVPEIKGESLIGDGIFDVKKGLIALVRTRIAKLQGEPVDQYRRGYDTVWNLEATDLADLSRLAKTVLMPILNAYNAGNFDLMLENTRKLEAEVKTSKKAKITIGYLNRQMALAKVAMTPEEKQEYLKSAAGFVRALTERNLCDRYSDKGIPLSSKTHRQLYGAALFEAVSISGLVEGSTYQEAVDNFAKALDTAKLSKTAQSYEIETLVSGIQMTSHSSVADKIEFEAAAGISQIEEMAKAGRISMQDPIVITGMLSLMNLAQKDTPDLRDRLNNSNKTAIASVKAMLGAG